MVKDPVKTMNGTVEIVTALVQAFVFVICVWTRCKSGLKAFVALTGAALQYLEVFFVVSR